MDDRDRFTTFGVTASLLITLVCFAWVHRAAFSIDSTRAVSTTIAEVELAPPTALVERAPVAVEAVPEEPVIEDQATVPEQAPEVVAKASFSLAGAILALDGDETLVGLEPLPTPQDTLVWKTSDGRYLAAAGSQRRYHDLVDAIEGFDCTDLGVTARGFRQAGFERDVLDVDLVEIQRLERVVMELVEVEIPDTPREMISRNLGWVLAGDDLTSASQPQLHLLLMEPSDARAVQQSMVQLAVEAGWLGSDRNAAPRLAASLPGLDSQDGEENREGLSVVSRVTIP